LSFPRRRESRKPAKIKKLAAFSASYGDPEKSNNYFLEMALAAVRRP
jgi:hypothetical protein